MSLLFSRFRFVAAGVLAFIMVAGCTFESQAMDASMEDIDAFCLTQSYPDVVQGLERASDGTVWLMLHNGERVLYADASPVRYTSDGVPENATVSQSMAEVYPLESVCVLPPSGSNPGRTRSEAFLAALYGKDGKRLYAVRIGKESFRLAAACGVPEAFERVRAGLERLATDPAIRPYLFPFGGGYFHRLIAGTKRLSPHSYGIALDLNPRRGGYWRWGSRADYAKYPQAVVSLFEANGFIWGGKWNKFDLMHFEYRPELLCKARLLQKEKAGATVPDPA